MKTSTATSIATKPTDASPVEGGRGYYIYAISGRGKADGKADGKNLEAVEHGGLVAWVTQVDLEDFSPARLEADSSWLRDRAMLHDRVIKSIGEGAVVPVRFGTVVRGRGDVVSLLESHRETFEQLLGELEGKREWGLKIWAQERAETPAAPVRSGTEYLRRKKESQSAQKREEQERSAAVRECHAALSGQADRAVILAANALDDSARLLFKAAYLVSDGKLAAFRAALDDVSARNGGRGIQVAVSGPWPAYSFVNLQLSVGKEGTR